MSSNVWRQLSSEERIDLHIPVPGPKQHYIFRLVYDPDGPISALAEPPEQLFLRAAYWEFYLTYTRIGISDERYAWAETIEQYKIRCCRNTL